jgi:hypothetical protein
MAYRNHEGVLREREQAILEELASMARQSAALQSRRTELDAELTRIRSLLESSRAGAGLLAGARVASQCSESWEAMSGDERTRFCGKCGKNVYNVSAMAREDAERFLVENTGACLRLYRRADGTLLTSDCPSGSRSKRRLTLLRHAAGIALGLGAGAAIGAAAKALLIRPVEATVVGEATLGF